MMSALGVRLLGCRCVRHSQLHKYHYEDLRNHPTKNFKCHQLIRGTGTSATTSSARGVCVRHGGGNRTDPQEGGQQIEIWIQVCVRAKEGPYSGQGQHLQLQAEPHQGRQDSQEEAGQGHPGWQEDGIHQADQPRQQATGHRTGGRHAKQDRQDAEIQDHPAKEIVKLTPTISRSEQEIYQVLIFF